MLSMSGRYGGATAAVGVAAVAGILAFWYFDYRLPPIPERPLRIGFEHVPPVQIRTADGMSGLAVDTIREAAKRAHITLEWVETGTSSDEAFQKGLVDLWPLMADLPDRRKRVHLTRPWLHSGHAMLVRADAPVPGPRFTGRVALYRMPLHVRLLREAFPEAQPVQFTESAAALTAVCTGGVGGAYLELRAAMNALREKPAECGAIDLRAHMLTGQTLQLAIASTFDSAGAAERLRSEVSDLFRDGTMAVTMAKYSYYGLDDTWATYDLMEAAERARWLTGIIGGAILILGLLLWRILSARQRRRAEAVLRESEERFRAIFQQAAVGVAQVNLSGDFVMVNDRYCDVLGYTGTNFWEAARDRRHIPIDAERCAPAGKDDGGRCSPATDLRCFVGWRRSVDPAIRFAGAERREPAKYFIVVIKDIEQKADDALRESEARFRIWRTAPV